MDILKVLRSLGMKTPSLFNPVFSKISHYGNSSLFVSHDLFLLFFIYYHHGAQSLGNTGVAEITCAKLLITLSSFLF